MGRVSRKLKQNCNRINCLATRRHASQILNTTKPFDTGKRLSYHVSDSTSGSNRYFVEKRESFRVSDITAGDEQRHTQDMGATLLV